MSSQPPKKIAGNANQVTEQLTDEEMKELRDSLVDEGWVEVHDSKVASVWEGMPAIDRPRVVCHFEGYYVVVGKGKLKAKSFSPPSIIAGLTLFEANCISRILLGRVFVFLTKSAESQPTESFLIQYDDWQSLKRIRKSKGVGSFPREYFAALQIRIQDRASFHSVTVDADTLLNFENSLTNVMPWLAAVWSTSAKNVSSAEIKLRQIENKIGYQDCVSDRMFPLNTVEKRLLLHCHYFPHWEKKKADYNERADDLSKVDSAFANVKREKVSADEIDSGCRDASTSIIKRWFLSLSEQVRVLRKGVNQKGETIEPDTLFWLLSVVRARSFADSLAG
jgi:hypothetical protein